MVKTKSFLLLLLFSLLLSFGLLCSAADPFRKEEDYGIFNPFLFRQRKYAYGRYEEDNGSLWVLRKFYDKHLILKAYNEYRVAFLEANPNTFVLPHHCDADRIYVVTNGRFINILQFSSFSISICNTKSWCFFLFVGKGTLTLLTDKNRESFNLVPGVVVRVPTGSTVYLVNQDNDRKLTIAVLVRPVNNPGKFEEFFPGGQYPQSFYRHLSRDVLEAVLNAVASESKPEGNVRIASQEQIRTLSQGATTPREKEEGFAFNLFAQKPKYSNENGKFFEACPREFELLRDVDAAVVGFELNQVNSKPVPLQFTWSC
ncbi:Vicilin GC72-A [Hibiscus syriacus]|uniref:Vicilin GC72-A n=1 Tax=Hibiscus syriacus TaxID=106335 RepID=A0A6A2XPR7_HIBSY|nr:Vicilin GC72-A [Hibiscus syriacus]